MPADAVLPPPLGRLKIILGVDYGTTFTGVSYVTSEKTSENDIAILRTWPGNGCPVEGNWKTPTVIAYQSENPSASRDRWGYEVRPGMVSCSWTKLLLDNSVETAEYDDPSLRNATGAALFRLPPGKTAQRVCQDYLSHIYRFVVETLKNSMTPEVFDVTPMECFFTMPAIWSDRAQNATRQAAMAAGFGSRPHDTIRMITEPEAAAIAALKHDLRPGSVNAVKTGDNILVLDCGGGTVDITTYTVEAVEPRLLFHEICAGAGGKCGSTYVDRNFHQFMTRRFGNAFTRVPAKIKGPGSRFMVEFEKAKLGFGSSSDEDRYEIGPIPLGSGFRAAWYDDEEEAVILTRRDMEEIFAPVVNDVLRLVNQQVQLAEVARGRRINLIILAGGFGNSNYLKAAIDKWAAAAGGIQCIRPVFCQAAIVRGAAIRGLERTMPTKLICRRHYGFEWALPFVQGVDDERHGYLDFGKKYCRGHMKWMMAKGTEITDTTSRSVHVCRTWTQGTSRVFLDELYSCNLDAAPGRQENPGCIVVGSITVDFSGVDLSMFEKRNIGTAVVPVFEYRISYQIRVDFRSDTGVLRFSCTVNGATIGTTTIDFLE